MILGLGLGLGVGLELGLPVSRARVRISVIVRVMRLVCDSWISHGIQPPAPYNPHQGPAGTQGGMCAPSSTEATHGSSRPKLGCRGRVGLQLDHNLRAWVRQMSMYEALT